MQVVAVDLARMLTDARARTLTLIRDLTDAQLIGPRLAIVNPLLWEIGHLTWFQEKWVLRHLHGEDPLLPNADALYDSAGIAHDERWSLPLPSRAETLTYMQRVLDRAIGWLSQRPPGDEEFYFYHLVGFHEDMHGEALVYTRQTLGYRAPAAQRHDGAMPIRGPTKDETETKDAEIPGGSFRLGSTRDLPFVFDNEKWAHEVHLEPFAISRTAVTNEEFRRFVEDQGYRRRQFWSKAGWRWREATNAGHPVYWVPADDGQWLCRRYDRLDPLARPLPVMHVNWYEAEAYCRWANRRLPTEAEWEAAASAEPGPDGQTIGPRKRRFPWGDTRPGPGLAHLDGASPGCIPVTALPAGDSAFGCRQMIGNVWEWTASDFEPYPGFVPDPYKEYSQPWCGGTHKVLRGGAFATCSRLVHNTYRNFYTPDRRDVLAGFRTCRL
jgi:iron(II)-dependent oxidoreductase